MAILGPDDANKVQAFLAESLREPVTIEFFTQRRSPLVIPGRQECEYCEETEQLLSEVAGLSDKIQLSVHDLRGHPDEGKPFGIVSEMVPAFVLRGENLGTVRYFGIPAGYEFTNFIQDLAAVSTGVTHLTQVTQESLSQLPGDVHIRVFVTPT
jgi:alkyl hydroperoxide reductase subunit AhpF